jgi:hypothetical protein
MGGSSFRRALVPEIGREPDTMMVRGAVFDPQVDFAVPRLARW